MSSSPQTDSRESSTTERSSDAPVFEQQVDVQATFDALPIPVYALDDEHTVILWSERPRALLGLSREEMLGSDELFGQNAEGDQTKTLANRVVDAPGSADQFDGIRRVDFEYASGVEY